MNKSNIILCGAGGQLGKTLQDLWPSSQLAEQFTFSALGHKDLDVTSAKAMEEELSRRDATIIINAAAYTAVDQAETDSVNSFAVNETAVANLASWAAINKAWLIHVSTDFVFDGAAISPYAPESETSPIGVYGASKRAGEVKVQQLLPDSGTLIRTSWLYSEYGNNFVKTMLRLLSERAELSVVNDQVGSPTSTHSLAQVIFAMIRKAHNPDTQLGGVYHWSDGGSISWFDFARAIQQQGLQQGLLSKQIPIKEIASSEYPTAAKRPAYSVLDRSKTLAEFDCPELNWKQQLAVVIEAIAANDGNDEA